jgi:hypothetical protein
MEDTFYSGTEWDAEPLEDDINEIHGEAEPQDHGQVLEERDIAEASSNSKATSAAHMGLESKPREQRHSLTISPTPASVGNACNAPLEIRHFRLIANVCVLPDDRFKVREVETAYFGEKHSKGENIRSNGPRSSKWDSKGPLLKDISKDSTS